MDIEVGHCSGQDRLQSYSAGRKLLCFANAFFVRHEYFLHPKSGNLQEVSLDSVHIYTNEFLRKGRTSVVRKAANPTCRPTPSMLARNPALPRVVGPGPDNPLGAFALYLSWQYFAIHGSDDPVSIGRRTTSGCLRLLPTHIEWLYENAPIGTRVSVI